MHCPAWDLVVVWTSTSKFFESTCALGVFLVSNSKLWYSEKFSFCMESEKKCYDKFAKAQHLFVNFFKCRSGPGVSQINDKFFGQISH